jgi:hypothetical protein
MWAIQARVIRFHGRELTAGSRDLPTFYLDERVQGIQTERHAIEVARMIIDPYSLAAEDDVSITAVRMPSS